MDGVQYLGWGCFDPSPAVRLAAVSAVNRVAARVLSPAATGASSSSSSSSSSSGAGAAQVLLSSRLEGFVQRFVDRFVEMAAGDVDAAVARETVAALRKLNK